MNTLGDFQICISVPLNLFGICKIKFCMKVIVLNSSEKHLREINQIGMIKDYKYENQESVARKKTIAVPKKT